jgi:hypothetical protein
MQSGVKHQKSIKSISNWDPEYLERTIDHGQATGKLYHLRLRVECTFFVINKGGREPTP